ncbi:MAG TPA: 23S rRNA (adenine(2503)-C(2))-methyltransferase RlmN [Phycisphaerae bacterium]|nr:23S rRNA (adenine(2503)-C(2))-methyltransferase RlmN [Phycisphaerae bacterium]HPS51936.1 23S rRNA (adenine(2503)-C(2))-methyltransferase RlmN [Phycisphaerae bacterium]
MIHILDITPERFCEHIERIGEKKFRATQILQWIWQKRVTDFALMSDLSKKLRENLFGEFDIITGSIAARRDSGDGCVKLLVEYPDGERIETVAIPAEERLTACVSTQAGCAMACSFCASGLDGLRRNLTSGEIVQQVLLLEQATGQRVTNVVFMGMGEPLANLDATINAVRTLADSRRGAISARKITVSTSGLPKQIRQLAELELPITLAISLHAPNDELRRKLMPVASRYPIAEIISAAAEFFNSHKREVTLEYTLIGGINDSPQCAAQLAAIAATLRCNVNLIRYNPVSSLPYVRPDERVVNDFAELLRRKHVNVTVRRSKGIDADSACGQLRRRNA